MIRPVFGLKAYSPNVFENAFGAPLRAIWHNAARVNPYSRPFEHSPAPF